MSGTAAPAVEIEALWTRYGETQVLKDVTLAIDAGEIFGLLGPNGAGKSTLLKAVVRLVEPEAGTVRVFGAAGHPAARCHLAYLPERFQPPGHLPGRDFLRLALAFHRCPARRAPILALAQSLELDPAALDQPISCYAKGMAQKLGILATLLTDRPLLVLDEPMSGLAPAARRLVRQQLAAQRERGRTVLLSSPIPADHDQLCDRIAIMDRGRLADVGAPGELQARYGAPTLATAIRAAIERPCPRSVSAPQL